MTRTSRKRKESGSADASTFLTVYADMVSVLMAFFVMLYAMSSTDVLKFQAFLSGLAEPFGNQAAGSGVLPGNDGLIEDGSPSLDPVVPVAERSGLVGSVMDEAAGDGDAADPADEATPDDDDVSSDDEARVSLDDVDAALQRALADAGLSDLVERRREERGLTVSVSSDDVLFALGSTDISPVGEQVIATVATTLLSFDNDVLVEGHTDDIPLRRPGYTNWNLSTDRAVAVLTEVVERHRFPPDRIGAVGYGEFRPLESNDRRSGRARNRRVDIVVLHEEISL